MIEDIINPENWKLISPEAQLQARKADKEEKNTSPAQLWLNSAKAISPLSIYEYLKARFGPPNGLVMLLKKKTADNLVHWQYALEAYNAAIYIWGKSSGVEIAIKGDSLPKLTSTDWEMLIANIQKDWKKYSKEMRILESAFEHWSLFINPFARTEIILQDYIHQLEKLNLDEPEPFAPGSKESFDKYMKGFKRWIKNITKAVSIGTTIRVLCPIMAESFINLIILVFRKEEYRKDERLYENLVRQQIDVRIKTLHLHCSCFPLQIDSGSQSFKDFQTLMNKRNDFLHGNIDPYKLIVEDVWFDFKNIPLFKVDEGVIKKMLRNYSANVEPQVAISDFQIISNLIEIVLMSMDDKSLRIIINIMASRMPGIEKKTKRLGVLFPTGPLSEFYASS